MTNWWRQGALSSGGQEQSMMTRMIPIERPVWERTSAIVKTMLATLLGILFLIGPTAHAQDTDATTPLVFVFTGESNSGGIGRNADASPEECKPRPSVQIMNLTNGTFRFEDLQLGVNNLRDHHRLQDYYDNSHGLENGLAAAVESGRFPHHERVYLVKTGQGGSRISQWTAYPSSGYWTKFVQRIEAGKRQLPDDLQWVVWFSLGINDAIDEADVDSWKKDTQSHLNRIREQLPGAMVVMTQFQSMKAYPEFDAAIQEVAASMPDVVVVDTSGASLRDANHWDYAGLKTVAARMVEATRAAMAHRAQHSNAQQ